ncbi:hypothetical protein HU200_062840 [Digitaria exilis]|uniref:Retrovirus-related Pol polyprotein from transposon TNT 1-94-like beta-barrel domain-containing protein n=1 Tax=Digitaria exilis TaxID=1010633 RepID=A0A835A2J2_9POAL|nr:hypothetical protein HU200_062840 [Digitaria exilis]
MAGDTVAISVKDQGIQPRGIRQIGTPGLDGSEVLIRFSIQEDMIKTLCDAQRHDQGGVLLGPLVPDQSEERSRPNLDDDVPAEDDGVPRVTLPICTSIFMFVHGRGPIDFMFILDSGASVHATPRYYLLKDLKAVAAGQSVLAANGKKLHICGRGCVSLDNITLYDVNYIPGLTANIVSVSKLMKLDYEINFLGTECVIKDTRSGRAEVGKGHLINNGVFVLDYLLIPPGRAAATPQGPVH